MFYEFQVIALKAKKLSLNKTSAQLDDDFF